MKGKVVICGGMSREHIGTVSRALIDNGNTCDVMIVDDLHEGLSIGKEDTSFKITNHLLPYKPFHFVNRRERRAKRKL